MLVATQNTKKTMINGYEVNHTIELYQWADGTLELVDYSFNDQQGHHYRDAVVEMDPNATVGACLAVLVDELKPYGEDGLKLLSAFTSLLQTRVSGNPSQPSYCLVGALD